MSVMPDVPNDPRVWIDPTVLQLAGLGTTTDPYLHDGRHLRWFFGRMLGFPRSGFRLFRRRSPFDNAPDLRRLLLLMGGQITSRPQLGDGSAMTFASGCGISKANGFRYSTVNGQELLRVDANAVTISLFPSFDYPKPPMGPTACDPAAYVLLRFWRRETAGFVKAEGFYASGGELHFQSAASAGTAPGCLNFALGPWKEETLLLHGGLLERIVITGGSAVLAEVRWLPARSYAQADGWQPMGEFFLPLTDAPGVYPEWSAAAGATIAAQRLQASPPRAMPPWDEPLHPPPPAAPATVAADLQRRYLAPFPRVDGAMRTFLAGELSQLVPQALVEVPQVMTWESNPPDGGGAKLLFRPFDHLYTAAADPQMARLLGLMTTDTADAAGTWDYHVTAEFPTLWLWWMLFPKTAEQIAENLREQGFDSMQPSGFSMLPMQQWQFRAMSMVTRLERGNRPLPAAPPDFTATAVPNPGRKNVQCDVALAWDAPKTNLFAEPRQARIFFAARRQGAQGDVSINRPDPDDPKIRMPIVTTGSSVEDDRATLTDRTLPAYGTYTWRLSGMDPWGRFSPYATASATAADLVPPNAPSKVEAELTGTTAGAPQWASLVVSFEWGGFHQSEAPDVTAFDIHVRQGKVASKDAQNAATWGRLEHQPGALTPPLRITAGGAVVSPPAGLTVSVSQVDDRIFVSIAPVTAPFGANGFARMSATVTAVDAASNVSEFAARAVAQRADDTPPPAVALPGPALTSYPDARGRAHYRVALATPNGRSTQVLRATQARLLGAGNVSDAQFAALADDGARVQKLKELAAAHPRVFTPDHALPYGHTAKEHVAVFNGLERTWSVLAVRQTSQTGVPGTWPDAEAFRVVAVRRALEPRVPRVVRTQPGDRSVTLHIAPDPTGATQKVRIFRTRIAAKLDDVRGMQPVAVLDASDAELVFTDTELWPDTPYFYRLVAGGAGNARSEASVVVSAKAWSSTGPAAPELLEVKKTPGTRSVRFRVVRRDYHLTVFRRAFDAPSWELIAADTGPHTALDLAAHGVAPSGEAYEVTVSDPVPDDTKAYSYFVRMRDPRERHADSAAVKETA